MSRAGGLLHASRVHLWKRGFTSHCGRTSMLAIRFYENHCTIVLHSEQRSKPQTEFNGYVSDWSFAKELLTLLRPFQIAVGVKNDLPLKLS
ncbi:hypothetical protein V1478_016984 [Vespula squamosa]|uniref:Uncharacterized protein n=1 Tax=Vespula squamosa TaxID=30214 RepID=A0ABD1ZYN1_VESSQ